MRTANPKAMKPMSPKANDLFALKANLAVVVRGSMDDLAAFAERVEQIAPELGLIVVHKQASASKLWIQEGEG